MVRFFGERLESGHVRCRSRPVIVSRCRFQECKKYSCGEIDAFRPFVVRFFNRFCHKVKVVGQGSFAILRASRAPGAFTVMFRGTQ